MLAHIVSVHGMVVKIIEAYMREIIISGTGSVRAEQRRKSWDKHRSLTTYKCNEMQHDEENLGLKRSVISYRSYITMKNKKLSV